jgi:hypothetical protein
VTAVDFAASVIAAVRAASAAPALVAPMNSAADTAQQITAEVVVVLQVMTVNLS